MDRRTNSFGGSLDVPVPDMRVAKRHRDAAMTEQPCDDRDRNALQHGLAREAVTQIVEAHVLDPARRRTRYHRLSGGARGRAGARGDGKT